MPILTLQRRLREAGRIRIGQQVATSGGKKRPAKLDKFRLTSSDRTAIEAAAALYGGTPHPWEGAPIAGHWEVFTDAQVIPVVVPPAAAAFSQWNETWSGGGCTRRCDGERLVSLDGINVDEPCLCASEDEASCKPTTRLNVILGQLPGLGVWRLESHGFYAATELAGTVEVVMGAATRGQLLPATLRLEHREVRRVGQPVRKFVVPILDIAVTPNALGLVVGTSAPAAAIAPAPEPDQTWKPIAGPPPAAEIGPGDVADRIQNAQKAPPKKRANSAPPVPRSGQAPRGRTDTAERAPSPAAGIRPRGNESPTEPRPIRAGNVVPISDGQMMKLQATFNDLGIKERDAKHEFVTAIVGRTMATARDLTFAEASKSIDVLEGIKGGRLTYGYVENVLTITAATNSDEIAKPELAEDADVVDAELVDDVPHPADQEGGA